jgi:hypothetical protein
MAKPREMLRKSAGLASHPRFVINKWPGQVPNKDNLAALRLANEAPAKFSVARLLQHDGAYLSPKSVVDGIGLDPGKASEWVEHLGKAVRSTNELTYRQDIMGKMLHDRMDGATRQALFQRAMGYYRDMRKSLVTVTTADELAKGHALEDESVTARGRLHKAIHRRVHRAPKGVPLAGLQDLVRQYGVRDVAAALDEACGDRGGLAYRDGVLIGR